MTVPADPQAKIPFEPFFFANEHGVNLLGVWREPMGIRANAPLNPHGRKRVWVICAPFAEEEKSAHRTLVELCERLREGSAASLYFAYGGTGDSDGNFREASLTKWRGDVRSACGEARERWPGAVLCLCGLRLGASLAIAEATACGADQCVLIEPILQGKSLLTAVAQKKRLRAMMTKNDSSIKPTGSAATKPSGTTIAATELPDDDFDGWALGSDLRSEMEAFDLIRDFPAFEGKVSVIQVGPRESVAPSLEQWARRFSGIQKLQAVKMPAFWNALDYARADALFAELESEVAPRRHAD
jgi:hypothetical protein